jgi:hypothetical protein
MSLVSLFLNITLIYFNYSSISYKVLLSYMSDMFFCFSPILDLEVCVLHEHNPLILCYRFINSRICLYD